MQLQAAFLKCGVSGENADKDSRDLFRCSLEWGWEGCCHGSHTRQFQCAGRYSLSALSFESVPERLLIIQGFFIRGMNIKSISLSSPQQKSLEILLKSLKKCIHVFLKWTLNNFIIQFNVQHTNYSTVPCKKRWSKFHLISKKPMCYYTTVRKVLIHIFFSFSQLCCFCF